MAALADATRVPETSSAPVAAHPIQASVNPATTRTEVARCRSTSPDRRSTDRGMATSTPTMTAPAHARTTTAASGPIESLSRSLADPT